MLLTVTDAGLSAITTAAANSLLINITTFKVTSSVAFTPVTTATALPGTVMHSQLISGTRPVGIGEIAIDVQMDDTVGDFNFGGLGLYLADGTLFAYGSLPTLQSKTKTVATTSVGNIVSFDCRIVVDQVQAVINFTTPALTNAKVIEAPYVDSLRPPSVEGTNAFLTLSLDTGNASIPAFKATSMWWSFPSFSQVLSGVVSGGTLYTANYVGAENTVINVTHGKYILAFTSGALNGYARMVTACAGGILSWSNAFPTGSAPQAGDGFVVWQSNHSIMTALIDTVNNFTGGCARPCKVVATSPITLAGLQTVDTRTLALGDRVLVTGQTNTVENGIYVVQTGVWTRPVDFTGKVASGLLVPIGEGAQYGETVWQLATDNPVVVGSSGLIFVVANSEWLRQFMAQTLSAGLPCRLAATSNITLAGLQTIDGISTAVGDRVLVTGQTNTKLNGIYIAAVSQWVRALDADASPDFVPSQMLTVSEGSTWGDSVWQLVSNAPLTLGTSAILYQPANYSWVRKTATKIAITNAIALG